jgi:hypothetical protein
MHCRYAPSDTADEWSLDRKLLSLIVRGLANSRPDNKSCSKTNSLPAAAAERSPFLRNLSAGSLGCGNNFVEALITAQRIPTRIELELANPLCSRINVIRKSHPESIRGYSSGLFKRMAPARFISSSARSISPGSSSIPRQPSTMTYAFKPRWRASSALYLTQYSNARPIR